MESKPTLIICGSDKGGVGKTTVSRAVLDYLRDRNVQSPNVFDTEPGEGVLRRFSKSAKPVDVLTVRGQMQVFDDVPKAGYTFVDLKAGEQRLKIKAEGESTLREGDVAFLSFEPHCAHLFDRASGERLN